jgi:hypothetical protein
MTLMNFLRGLGRRWYIVVAGLLLAAGISGITYFAMSPTYERTASVLLVPGAGSIPAGGNPYLYLGGLSQASDVLVRALGANDVRDPILLGHPDTDFTVTRDATTSGPLLAITVEGANDSTVITVLEGALAAIPATLTDLQDEAAVPDDSRISSLSLTVDPTSDIVQKGRIETVGFIGAAIVAGTLLLAGLVDGLALSNWRRGAFTLRSEPAADTTDNAEARALARAPRLEKASR